MAKQPWTYLFLTYLSFHYAYFITVSLLVAVVFWATGHNAVSFVDSLFLTVSAMTEAGLNTVNLSQLNTFQQVALFFLICIGSALSTSWVLLYVRKTVFERRYRQIIQSHYAELKDPHHKPEDLSSALRTRGHRPPNIIAHKAQRVVQEYEALSLLVWLVPLYFTTWQVLGCLGLGAWIFVNAPATTTSNGLNPMWAGIFQGASAFNNNGMTLQDANLVAFKDNAYVLLTTGLLILAGNSCYPVILRAIIWTLWKFSSTVPFLKRRKSTLRFLLDRPRDVYTHLFPTRTTWWLLFTVVMLNGIDWTAFEILNIHNPVVTSLPTLARVIDGLFQATAVRFGGFYVAPIAELNIALLVLYLIMMYISAYPVAISIRSTNIFDREPPRTPATVGPVNHFPAATSEHPRLLRFLNSTLPKPISHHVSRQLTHDLWYMALAVLLIMVIESSQFVNDPVAFSAFNVIFEVVSAYGTVGISVGLPGQAYSFCGGWHTGSKLVLMAVMIRGRHRGLPDVIDRAVMMPGVELVEAERRSLSAEQGRVATKEEEKTNPEPDGSTESEEGPRRRAIHLLPDEVV